MQKTEEEHLRSIAGLIISTVLTVALVAKKPDSTDASSKAREAIEAAKAICNAWLS